MDESGEHIMVGVRELWDLVFDGLSNLSEWN